MKSGYLSLGRALMPLVIAGGLAKSVTANPLVPLDSNTPNSVVLSNGERVCDIAGDWNAKYEVNWGVVDDVVRVVRSNEEFVGTKLIGHQYVGKGQKTIRGKLKMNGFEKFQTYDSRYDWVDDTAEFNKNCNVLTIKGFDYTITLKK